MRPDPNSNRSLKGTTPSFIVGVEITMRAKNTEAARERVERWLSQLERDSDSVDSTQILDCCKLDTNPATLRASIPTTKEQ